MNDKPDVRALVRWLGSHGARAGLEQSKCCTIELLMAMARELGLSPAKGIRRKELVEEIIRIAARRIDKTLDELMQLGQDDLIDYFERIGIETEELVDLIKEMNLTPRDDGRRHLIEFAARELSETGRFKRISEKGMPQRSKQTLVR
jgi:hypothetical protein